MADRRRRLQALAVCICTAGLAALAAVPAGAHAYVTASVPEDGAVLDEAPSQISITFDDAVQAPIAAVKVYDRLSSRVDTGETWVTGADRRTVVGTTQSDLADGTYVVTWRALSWDGHTIIGSFSFSVGSPSALAVPATSLVEATPRPVAVVAAVGRAAALLGTLLAVGAGLFFLLVLRERPASWEAERSSVRRLATVTARVALAGTVAALLVHPVEVAGSTAFGDDTVTAVAQAFTSPFGAASVARALALVPLALGIRAALPEVFVTLWSLALASLAIDGHAATASPAWLLLTADLVHLAAAAVWTGGLVAVALVVRRRRRLPDPVGAAQLVAEFSGMAAACLAAVAVSGSVLAIVLVGSPTAAATTTYGRLLVAKLGLVSVVLAIAAVNRFRLVPRIGRAADVEDGLATLGRTVRIEGAVLLSVVALTSVLGQTVPASTQSAAAEQAVAAVLADTEEAAATAPTSAPPLANLLALSVASLVAGLHVVSRRRRRVVDDLDASGAATPVDELVLLG